MAIIAAAGKGERFGGDLPKQYLPLGDKPLLVHTLMVFEESNVDGVILVVDEERIQFCKDSIVNKYHLKKVKGIVSGGKCRQESVYNGLKTMEEMPPEIVIIHDGVRPFVSRHLIEDVIQEATITGAAIAGVPVDDTIKLVNDDGIVKHTIERKGLWYIQTPQGFRYGLLKEGFEKAIRDGFVDTDEAILVERLNLKVKIVRGFKDNIKITTRDDFTLAMAIFRNRLKLCELV